MPVPGSGSAFGSPVLETSRGSKYRYRHRMGLVPCAEFDVFHDDFHSFVVGTAITNGPVANTPWGWQGAIIDSGATNAISTTATLGANGVIAMADATASEGTAIYTNKSFQLISGKRFFMEVRIYTNDVTDNEFLFGLSDQTATTNPEDLGTTAAANVVSFGILDGSAVTKMLSDKSDGGTSAQTGDLSLTASAWNVLAIYYDGGSVLQGFVNGALSLTWSGASSTIPTATALGLFVSARNGDGGGGNVNLVDYVRAVSER